MPFTGAACPLPWLPGPACWDWLLASRGIHASPSADRHRLLAPCLGLCLQELSWVPYVAGPGGGLCESLCCVPPPTRKWKNWSFPDLLAPEEECAGTGRRHALARDPWVGTAEARRVWERPGEPSGWCVRAWRRGSGRPGPLEGKHWCPSDCHPESWCHGHTAPSLLECRGRVLCPFRLVIPYFSPHFQRKAFFW